jgi:hypothetical protein
MEMTRVHVTTINAQLRQGGNSLAMRNEKWPSVVKATNFDNANEERPTMLHGLILILHGPS